MALLYSPVTAWSYKASKLIPYKDSELRFERVRDKMLTSLVYSLYDQLLEQKAEEL